MRITKLHLLLALLGFVCMVYGVLVWVGDYRQKEAEKRLRQVEARPDLQSQRMAAARDLQQQERLALEHRQREIARSVATVGEAYQPLRKQFGDIPPIAGPLRRAKSLLASGDYETALAASREAWDALKKFKRGAASLPGVYEVVRGDTLWRIAATQSPVRRGAGWVAIWKANSNLVKDFDRIEVGWNLQIPQQRSQYVTPYWRPH